MEKLKDELNSVGEALKQIEKHNEKIKSDIAISRRVTYATEEDILKAEKDKREQDLFIAHLKRENERRLEKKEIILAKISGMYWKVRFIACMSCSCFWLHCVCLVMMCILHIFTLQLKRERPKLLEMPLVKLRLRWKAYIQRRNRSWHNGSHL